MLKASLPDQQVVEVRNPNYFRRGRPYLDSVQFIVFKSADSHHAALIAKQIDAAALLATPGPVYERLKAGRHGVEFAERVTNATVNIIFNTKKPPFDDVAMRRIVNLALDRESAIKTVFQSGGVPGTAFVPKPYGAWGATPEQLRALPGMGPSEENKAEARRLLREKGYSDAKPFRFTMTTRNTVTTTGSSNWGVGELKNVGILAEIKLVDTGNWYGIVARRDFLFAFNETAIVIDDPDAGLYENYTCHSQRNYTDYCNPELEKKFDEQSLESDPARRRSLVQEIDFKLQADGARPYITYRKDWYAHYPWVKNYVPQAAIYNNWRMDDLWLDQ
jgi:peptide/nickel transport system substrate-binding protein